jgi:hypothetical protein
MGSTIKYWPVGERSIVETVAPKDGALYTVVVFVVLVVTSALLARAVKARQLTTSGSVVLSLIFIFDHPPSIWKSLVYNLTDLNC